MRENKTITTSHEYTRKKSGAVQYAKHYPEGQMQCAACISLPKMPVSVCLGQREYFRLLCSSKPKSHHYFGYKDVFILFLLTQIILCNANVNQASIHTTVVHLQHCAQKDSVTTELAGKHKQSKMTF